MKKFYCALHYLYLLTWTWVYSWRITKIVHNLRLCFICVNSFLFYFKIDDKIDFWKFPNAFVFHVSFAICIVYIYIYLWSVRTFFFIKNKLFYNKRYEFSGKKKCQALDVYYICLMFMFLNVFIWHVRLYWSFLSPLLYVVYNYKKCIL